MENAMCCSSVGIRNEKSGNNIFYINKENCANSDFPFFLFFSFSLDQLFQRRHLCVALFITDTEDRGQHISLLFKRNHQEDLINNVFNIKSAQGYVFLSHYACWWEGKKNGKQSDVQ